MKFCYRTNEKLDPEPVIGMYRRSGLRRPLDDPQRMQKLLENSNLVITAWIDDRVIGIARCLHDVEWVCYLADLAVDREFQRQGIGRELVDRVRTAIGPRCQLLLLSAPEALEYYPKLNFERIDCAFHIIRAE